MSGSSHHVHAHSVLPPPEGATDPSRAPSPQVPSTPNGHFEARLRHSLPVRQTSPADDPATRTGTPAHNDAPLRSKEGIIMSQNITPDPNPSTDDTSEAQVENVPSLLLHCVIDGFGLRISFALCDQCILLAG